MTKSVKVIIVGAGVSGLKAAETLISCGKLGKDDIVVLEAQDKVGGRIQDSKIDQSKLGIPYALGALWYHDSLANSVLKEMLETGLLKEEDIYYDDKDGPTYTSEGQLDVSGLRLNRVLEEVIQFFHLYFNTERQNISCDEVVKEYIKSHSFFLTTEQKQYIRRAMRYYELWYGVPAETADGRMVLETHQGRNILNKKGYTFLIDTLLEKIPESSILLNQPVKSVTQRGGSTKRVVVGTKSGLEIEADFVVVTVPLSILKLKADDEFGITWNPSLPSKTQNFINAVDFAALGKVIFEFNNVWWNQDEDQFLILPDEIESKHWFNADGSPRPFSFPALAVNYSRLYNRGGSLVILTPAPLTDYLESHPDQAWTYFKPMLEKIAVNSVEDPISTITSSWTLNPYIRGSYSAVLFKPTNSESKNPDDLEGLELGNDVIRFAGEHTVTECSGCVHSAYDSGVREANWILNALQDFTPNL
ncbi:CBP1 [Candida margitis]|uniref:CBP1 n=1 Tax=Candida margitis TaxID=1775924 RepID=UPI002227C3E0|nr:CBP1 [Candida margitis]KAI5969202.1 CBP1 [Candida margitis]